MEEEVMACSGTPFQKTEIQKGTRWADTMNRNLEWQWSNVKQQVWLSENETCRVCQGKEVN